MKNLFATTSLAGAAPNPNRQAVMVLTMAAVVVFALLPEVAMAAAWDSTAQKVLSIFTGGLGRTLAILAVIVCGILALFGKLSWDLAGKIVIGIVLVFGATNIVDYFISAAAG